MSATAPFWLALKTSSLATQAGNEGTCSAFASMNASMPLCSFNVLPGMTAVAKATYSIGFVRHRFLSHQSRGSRSSSPLESRIPPPPRVGLLFTVLHQLHRFSSNKREDAVRALGFLVVPIPPNPSSLFVGKFLQWLTSNELVNVQTLEFRKLKT